MNEKVAILREAATKIVQIVSERGIRVTQEGTRAYVEHDRQGHPTRVNIPFIPDNASDELIAAIQGFMDHELGHLLYSDLALLAKSHSVSKLVGQLHNILEDPCVAEAMMTKKFYGSSHNLKLVQEFFLNKYTHPKFVEVLAAGDMDKVMGALMVPAIRAWAGQQVFVDYMADKWELMAPMIAKLGDCVERVAKCTTTQDTYDLAIEMVKRMEAKPPQSQPQEGEGGEGGQSKQQQKKQNKKDSSKQDGQNGNSDQPDTQDDGNEGSGDSQSDKEQDSDKKDKNGKGSGQSDKKDKQDKKSDQKNAADDADEQDDGNDAQPDNEPESDGGSDGGEDEDAADNDGQGGQESEPAGDGEPDQAGDENGQDDGGDNSDTGEQEADSGENSGDSEGDGSESGENQGDDAGGDSAENDTDSGMNGEGASGGESSDGGDDGEAEADMDGERGGELHIGDSAGAIDTSKIDEELENGFDEALSILISRAALDAQKVADYVVFTKDNDLIEPLKVSRTFDDKLLSDLDEKVRHMVGPIQKDLERAIAAQSKSRWEAGKRSGKINPAGLHRFAVGDLRVFREKIVSRSKETAVSLVIDCSGSMGGPKIATAAATAYALSQTLERLGVSHEIIGFTTKHDHLTGDMWQQIEDAQKQLGRGYTRIEAVYMPLFKGFNERMTTEVKKRMAWLPKSRILANNIDGESIEIAARRLLQRREARKIMIVLSDGNPNASGNNWTLMQHLKDTVAQCEKLGISMIGLGIEDESVKHYYPKHIVIRNVDELPGKVIKEIKAMLLKQ